MAAVDATTNSPEDVGTPASSPPRALTPIQELDTTDGDSPVASTKNSIADKNPPTAVIKFHVDSDISVLVKMGKDVITYQVSSCSVAAASGVWRELLYGQGAKNRPGQGEWVINLDGNAKALDTLFRIVHYQFNKVPLEPTLDEMYKLTLATAQYKCAHLVHPWAAKWVDTLSTYSADEDCYEHCDEALWVAWEFGDVKLFRDMTDALIVSAKLDAEGDIVNVAGKKLKDMILPTGLLDRITTMRMATIAKVFDAINRPLQALSSGKRDPNVSYCKVRRNDRECEAMMLGSAIPTLMMAGLYPVPDSSKYTDSLDKLRDTINDIKLIPYVGREWLPHQGHDGCNLGFRSAIHDCLKEMPTALDDNTLEHLAAQSEVAGISNGRELEDYRRRASEKDEASTKAETSSESENAKDDKDEADKDAKSTTEEEFSDAQESADGSEADGSDVTAKEEGDAGSV